MGGVARFWVPQSWEVEESEEHGGRYYDPDGDAVLRLNVLVFGTANATGPPVLRFPRKPGERQIDGGTLPNDCEFDVYEFDTVDDDGVLHIRYWQISQVLPGQVRVYLFSYAYPEYAAAALAPEIDVLDRELRRMIPHPDPI
ncbi:hypothetical protein [Dactylosporangium darangshiense]|uniref:Uncharacterized protein n=1 Tax=Dactylosporangium darangshiense TaxID=579108 RepID=A0ABP8DHE5_9ACTN